MNRPASKNRYSTPPVLCCLDISKVFQAGHTPIPVLRSLSLTVQAGENIAIIGRSGSGKSTLLHILGGLEAPTSGQVLFKGQDLSQLKEPARSTCRHQLSIIYQSHHLLTEFTVLENVCMPLLIQGVDMKQAKARAYPLLEQAALQHRMHHKPSALSGGEKQRVAVIRALITQPSCILADEPTGNLDSQSAQQVLAMLVSLKHASLILVTHDQQLAQQMDSVLRLEDGCLTTL
jgi:lipoprotein-releasing system ATP-binding protein